MPEDTMNEPRKGEHFKIVGRDSRIDLSRYTVNVHGRDVIDYEKLRQENPALYREILLAENESNALNENE